MTSNRYSPPFPDYYLVIETGFSFDLIHTVDSVTYTTPYAFRLWSSKLDVHRGLRLFVEFTAKYRGKVINDTLSLYVSADRTAADLWDFSSNGYILREIRWVLRPKLIAIDRDSKGSPEDVSLYKRRQHKGSVTLAEPPEDGDDLYYIDGSGWFYNITGYLNEDSERKKIPFIKLADDKTEIAVTPDTHLYQGCERVDTMIDSNHLWYPAFDGFRVIRRRRGHRSNSWLYIVDYPEGAKISTEEVYCCVPLKMFEGLGYGIWILPTKIYPAWRRFEGFIYSPAEEVTKCRIR